MKTAALSAALPCARWHFPKPALVFVFVLHPTDSLCGLLHPKQEPRGRADTVSQHVQNTDPTHFLFHSS